MTIRVRKGRRGTTYQADLMINGVRYKKTFPSEAEAKLYEAQVKVDVGAGRAPVSPSERKANSAKLQTINDLHKKVSEERWAHMKVAQNLIGRSRLFVRYVGKDTPIPEALSQEKTRAYIAHMEELELAPGTINRRLSSVRVLADAADEAGLLPRVPRLKNRREPPGRLTWFSDEQCTAMFKYLLHINEVDYHDFCLFLLDTGGRVNEVRGLTWAYLPMGTRHVTFYDTKNGDNRTIPLTQRCRAVLEKRRVMGLAGPFSNTTARHDRRVTELLRDRFEWFDDSMVLHTFRHTCASRLVQGGRKLFNVGEWMGHKSAVSTQRYAHLSPEHLEDDLDTLEDRIVLETSRGTK